MAVMSKAMWRQLNSNKKVRAALESKAAEIASRARSNTAAAGGSARITTESGIRPRGRARVNVISSDASEEYGGQGKKRTRALGRAVRGG